MDGNIQGLPVNLASMLQQAMQDEISFTELRQQVWDWGAHSGWYHTTVEVIDGGVLITYFPSLSDGMVCERVPVLASYQSLLPSSDW